MKEVIDFKSVLTEHNINKLSISNNLVKINDYMALFRNKDKVISLLLKKASDYSFIDIISKKQEVEVLAKKIDELDDELKGNDNNNKVLKQDFLENRYCAILEAISVVVINVLVYALSLFNFNPAFLIFAGGFINLGMLILAVKTIKDAIVSFRKMKENIINPNDLEQELKRTKDLLNQKTIELNNMKYKANFHEYSRWDDIVSILNNVFKEHEANKTIDNNLGNDLSNKKTLDGPVRERKR